MKAIIKALYTKWSYNVNEGAMQKTKRRETANNGKANHGIEGTNRHHGSDWLFAGEYTRPS
jgi:hypothetical protein